MEDIASKEIVSHRCRIPQVFGSAAKISSWTWSTSVLLRNRSKNRCASLYSDSGKVNFGLVYGCKCASETCQNISSLISSSHENRRQHREAESCSRFEFLRMYRRLLGISRFIHPSGGFRACFRDRTYNKPNNLPSSRSPTRLPG